MTRRLGRARGAAGALVVGAAVLLTACAGTGYHYVSNSSDHTYFKVPDNWKLYDQNTVLDALKKSLSKDEIQQRRDTSWTTIFDASPEPSLSHLVSGNVQYPVGQAVVEQLSQDTSDSVSLQSLRNLFYNVDDALNNGTAHVSSYNLVEFNGGFHGSHLVARLDTKKGSITFNQIAVIDQGTSKVYAISVACSSDCYDKYQSKIDNVMSSWTVRDS
jgi:hypothetical protein